MSYTNNQYIRLDKPIEEIAKIEIETNKKNKLIEDIELGDNDVNVVIANGDKVVYNNIYGGIKILITDEKALLKNEFKIPEYIEKIIVHGCVYENNKREIERIKEGLKNGSELIIAIEGRNERLALELLKREEINVNKMNKYGNTALILACCNKMESVALKLLEREDINVNQVNIKGYIALMMACINIMERVALKLLEREDIHDPDGACRRIDHVKHGKSLCHVNQVSKYGNTALMGACCCDMKLTALKLLEREDININQVNKSGDTALIWVCILEQEKVALKLLEREDININQVNESGNTALIWVCCNKMERVVLKLLEREDINVNQVNKNGNTALNYAKLYRMESVIKRINELNNK